MMQAYYFVIYTVDGRINPKGIIYCLKDALHIIGLHIRWQNIALSEDCKNIVVHHPLQPCHTKYRLKFAPSY